MELKKKFELTIKKMPTSGALFNQFKDNVIAGTAGSYRIILHKNGASVLAEIDDKPIGFVMKDGARWTGDEVVFGSNGKCISDIKLEANGCSEDTILLNATVEETVNPAESEKASLTAFEKEIVHIVDAGICSRELVEDNIQVMLRNEVSAGVIRAVLNSYKKWDKEVCNPKTTYVPVDDGKYLELALIQALSGLEGNSGYAMVFQGGQSVGKNVMCETLAKVMHMPYYLITFNAQMNEDSVYGGKSTDNSASEKLTIELAEQAETDPKAKMLYEYYSRKAASVQIVMDYSSYCDWLENGGVMCFNEMNMAEANLFVSVANYLLDGPEYIVVPGRGKVKVNSNRVLLGTQNPGFVGAMQTNQATMSRFGFIDFGYAKDIKPALKASADLRNLNVPARVYERVAKFYNALRESNQNGTIGDAALNIRGFVKAIHNTVKYESNLRLQIMTQVVNGLDPKDKGIITTMIDNYFVE